MKKSVVSIMLISVLLLSLCSCDFINSEKGSIPKTNNTVISVYNALEDNFVLREKTGYALYGITLTVNSENVGVFTYVYTDKRPDDMKYSDILIVEVNNRTGKIEKFSSPDYATYGEAPFEMIKSAMPIHPSTFVVDSDKAMSNAAKTHYGDKFNYNYVRLSVVCENGVPVYKVSHISLVNDCSYNSTVDAMTGDVISSSVESLSIKENNNA